jgi:chorismate synthase
LGSYVQSDRKLDARLAAALMSIQSVKGVEWTDSRRRRIRSKAHDEIVLRAGAAGRRTARAGGIENRHVHGGRSGSGPR